MYKYPLALTVLHLADTGKLLPDQRPGESMDVTLDRTVRFLPTDIIPGSYSPLTVRYPKANVDVTLRELVRLAVGQSDNGAEEVLIRLVGGPPVVQSYIRSLGISAFHLVYSERDLDRDENLQYQDWIEPSAAVQLLERLVNTSNIAGCQRLSLANDDRLCHRPCSTSRRTSSRYRSCPQDWLFRDSWRHNSRYQ
jgi:beta-lactamase class A